VGQLSQTGDPVRKRHYRVDMSTFDEFRASIPDDVVIARALLDAVAASETGEPSTFNHRDLVQPLVIAVMQLELRVRELEAR
jgi:hypothetical protein